MAYVFFINEENLKQISFHKCIEIYMCSYIFHFYIFVHKTDVENNPYRSRAIIMGRCHIKKGRRGNVTLFVSSVSRSREQCKRHLFPFIKPDIFPTKSSGAIPFLSISFSFFLKLAVRTKAAQRPWNKRLSTVHKIPYNRLFLRAVKKDGMKEGWIFHFANPRLSFHAMRDLLLYRISFIPSLISRSFFFSLNSIAADWHVTSLGDPIASLKINKRSDR